jgi:uncharacterized protein (TIGR00269 family)
MFRPDDRIAVAVSGGKDSLSLLHILYRIEKRFPKSEIVAITVDEGIEGYRKEAVEIARENCRKLGMEHVVTSFEELYEQDLDSIVRRSRVRGEFAPCAYCGVLRRKALNVAARSVGATKLATAHNLDDEAQTMLLNVVHGDPWRIARVEPLLVTEHSKLVPRVKPLFSIPEVETALYAYLRGIRFQTIACPYVSGSLRNDIRVVLNGLEAKYPGMKLTVLRSFEKIRPALKERMKEVQLRDCEMCGEPTVGNICQPCQSLLDLGVIKSRQQD